jgi:hypothetical protein
MKARGRQRLLGAVHRYCELRVSVATAPTPAERTALVPKLIAAWDEVERRIDKAIPAAQRSRRAR